MKRLLLWHVGHEINLCSFKIHLYCMLPQLASFQIPALTCSPRKKMNSIDEPRIDTKQTDFFKHRNVQTGSNS